ncbi:HD domain-containing phosphohydrolase [Salicola sp. Rm-C-2C1-2]|uniref:HD-GYP domain-containing protein n=1 Tax=Salicola sp. Rm-C-2C1-2 TaxID=3141321 RepID=UPI0032E50FEC
MSDLVRLAPGLLTVGKPLPWPVYDRTGNLLVAQGYVIQSEWQLERLYEQGLYEPPERQAEKRREDDDTPRFSPFAEYSILLYELERALDRIVDADRRALERLEHLARRIQRLCQQDPDACIGLVHVYAVRPTAYEQTLFYAIICWLAAYHFELDENRTLILLQAALTANISLLPYLDKLNNTNRRLSEEQRRIIQKHPELSASALRQAGINDEVLLRIVEQHHECFDGSGYPEGISGPELLVEAKVVALAERYTAMITKRAYRERYHADQAMDEILHSMAQDPHQVVYEAVFQQLTPYPPGVLVQLANGETGLVTHRRRSPRSPVAQAIFNAQGRRYLGPLRRDASVEEYRVHSTLVPDMLPSLNLALLWGYS